MLLRQRDSGRGGCGRSACGKQEREQSVEPALEVRAGKAADVCPERVSNRNPVAPSENGKTRLAEVPADHRQCRQADAEADQPAPGKPRGAHGEPFDAGRIASKDPMSRSRWVGSPSGRWVLTV